MHFTFFISIIIITAIAIGLGLLVVFLPVTTLTPLTIPNKYGSFTRPIEPKSTHKTHNRKTTSNGPENSKQIFTTVPLIPNLKPKIKVTKGMKRHEKCKPKHRNKFNNPAKIHRKQWKMAGRTRR